MSTKASGKTKNGTLATREYTDGRVRELREYLEGGFNGALENCDVRMDNHERRVDRKLADLQERLSRIEGTWYRRFGRWVPGLFRRRGKS